MKCFLMGLMAGSLALVAMSQERAIARPVSKPSAEGLQYLDQQIRQPILKNAQLKDPAALEKIRQYRKAWSKKYPSIAPLLGDWSDGIEGGFGIYPSSKSGQVCVMPPFSARIQSGFIEGNTISFYEGNRGDDAMSIIYNLGREKVMGVKFSENPDSRLVPFFAYPPAVSSSPRGQMFEAQGCQVAPPEIQVADGRSPQNENGSDIYPSASAIQAALEANRAQRKACFSNDSRGRGCPPSIDTIPKTDQTTKNAWAKVDPQVARFLGSWYVGMEFLPHIYPSTVKGQVCVITHGDAIVFGIGRVTGKSLRYQDKAAYSMDGYADRSFELPYELNFFGNSGLLIFRSTDRPNSLNVAISTSSEIKPLDEYGNRFRNLFEAAGCTTGLPEETIAQPVKPLTPIAAASTYAYPSPAEFAQFKKTLKPSPVVLSTTDRKLRQDFQAEWQKKNRAIAPYVGAWKTADNQDVYVFPSTVSQRACVVQQKDGQLEMKLAVSMTADMRFDGNTGMFRVDPMTDVVAGRSDKSEPLSALYGAIGSPEVSASVKEELVQAGCVSELPGGGAIAKKDEVVKPEKKGALVLQANNEKGVQFTNPFPKKIQLNIKATGNWTFDPFKGIYSPDGMTVKDIEIAPVSSLLIQRITSTGTELYQNIGSSGKAILAKGESISFVMSGSSQDTDNESYKNAQGSISIEYEIVSPIPNPDIQIQLIFKKGSSEFTEEEKTAFTIAASNWEKLIMHDKDSKGILRIAVTKDDRKFGESWAVVGEPLKSASAAAAHIDKQVWGRTYYSSSKVEVDGEHFDNHITWNSNLTEGILNNLKPVEMYIPFAGADSYRKRLIVIMMHEMGHTLGLEHPSMSIEVVGKKYEEKSLMCSNLKGEVICYKGMTSGKDSITPGLVSKLQELGYEVDISSIDKLVWDWKCLPFLNVCSPVNN